MKLKTAVVCFAALFSAAAQAAPASNVNLDFSTYAVGETLSNLGGVSFSLSDTLNGPSLPGGPAINGWNVPNGLSNSLTGEMPSSNVLSFVFNNGPVNDISFTFFNNSLESGDNHTNVSYFGANGSALGSPIDLSATLNGEVVSFHSAVGISKLSFNNNAGEDNWLFSVSSLQASVSAVPEPSAALMFGLGLTALLAARRRKSL